MYTLFYDQGTRKRFCYLEISKIEINFSFLLLVSSLFTYLLINQKQKKFAIEIKDVLSNSVVVYMKFWIWFLIAIPKDISTLVYEVFLYHATNIPKDAYFYIQNCSSD